MCRRYVSWMLISGMIGWTVSHLNADPIQWEGNGHYYDVIVEQLTWEEAKQIAEDLSYLGRPGHLATINSAEENAFLTEYALGFSEQASYWLGGFQPMNSEEPGGEWQWVTGEEWSFTKWDTPNPSNTSGVPGLDEDVLTLLGPPYRVGNWNDVANENPDIGAFIVEFSKDNRNTEAPSGVIVTDFNLAPGDQGRRSIGDIVIGDTITVQLYLNRFTDVQGWSIVVEYDPGALDYVVNSFEASDLIENLTTLVDDQEGRLSLGGAVLGGDSESAGSEGGLGQYQVRVLNGFFESTHLVTIENSFRIVGDENQRYATYSIATLTEESLILPSKGDFDGSGIVDFLDFFEFADHFGTLSPDYDLDLNGAVDLGDFFIFADHFGQTIE